MVLKMIRRGRLVQKSRAQRRPRVSKLRAKELSGATLVSNSRGSQTGGQGFKIKGYSHDTLLKETDLKAALN
jgi:hypothetical protein